MELALLTFLAAAGPSSARAPSRASSRRTSRGGRSRDLDEAWQRYACSKRYRFCPATGDTAARALAAGRRARRGRRGHHRGLLDDHPRLASAVHARLGQARPCAGPARVARLERREARPGSGRTRPRADDAGRRVLRPRAGGACVERGRRVPSAGAGAAPRPPGPALFVVQARASCCSSTTARSRSPGSARRRAPRCSTRRAPSSLVRARRRLGARSVSLIRRTLYRAPRMTRSREVAPGSSPSWRRSR